MEKNNLFYEMKQIIEKEDAKNPLTDQEIAKKMNISRSEVSLLRQKYGVEDSRDRRKHKMISELKSMLEKTPSLSVRVATSKLNDCGYRISRNGVAGILKTLKSDMSPPYLETEEENNRHSSRAFDALIGASGSLKPQIELAKAAILYPNGLHTLIYGATGVGKSQMAECMYHFAIETNTMNAEAPFVVFNCADYADNPQLLMAQLYGFKKGTFTGAEEDKAGLVEKANHGILFLDEIHRLPSEGQEILFHLIDKGKFRRLGETDVYRTADILLIAATTENLESNLLATFRRRLPMLIELPTLAQRPLIERYRIIENFFRLEATRMKADLTITKNVLKALILYEPSGNIGKVWSDIQVICAKSFSKLFLDPGNMIKIDITSLPHEVVQGLLKLNLNRKAIEEVVTKDLIIQDSEQQIASQELPYILPREIYEIIGKKHKELQIQGVNEEIISRIIENELEMQIYNSVKRIRKEKSKIVKNDLERIVGSRIIETVEKMIRIAHSRFDDIDDSLFYCLATHLSASYDRLVHNESITNPKLEKIKEQHPKEFEIAREMSVLAANQLSIEIPEDEIAFIAVYLKASLSKEIIPQNQVGVLVLSHDQVAQGMANVANRLLGVDHAKAMEMSLDEAPSHALERTIRISKEMANDKGILFLADMGSLVGFGKMVAKELSVKTRTVARVDTMMVIEAVRKALMPESNLDEIADSLQKGQLVGTLVAQKENDQPREKAIVTICLTGEGSARILEEKIVASIASINESIEVIPMSALEEQTVSMRIDQMKNRYEVVSIVGTINPEIQSIPFIPAKEIIDGSGISNLHEYIRQGGLKAMKDMEPEVPQMVLADKLISETTTVLNAKMISKQECIDKMTNLLCEFGYVTESFKESVYEREAFCPTIFGGGIAVPHGDPSQVKKSVIGILTLDKPIQWTENDWVDCIFILAINEYYKTEFLNLYRITKDSYVLKKIKECKSFEEVKEVIRNA